MKLIGASYNRASKPVIRQAFRGSLLMRKHEVENWVLKIIESVRLGQPHEDFRVELKSDWIDPKKAAGLIGGHANAARGELILWIIGVDERTGVCGASHNNLANWFSSVKAQFDEGWAPQLLLDLNIPVENTTVVALLFETDRAPYVVKNPDGGTATHYVPWREGTSTRPARRAQLIRLLAPLQTLLNVEVLEGWLTVEKEPKNLWRWELNLELYVSTSSDVRVVIPFHKCRVAFEVPSHPEQYFFDSLNLLPAIDMNNFFMPLQTPSLTIQSTSSEVLIDGPGRIALRAFTKTSPLSRIRIETIKSKSLEELIQIEEEFAKFKNLYGSKQETYHAENPKLRVKLNEDFASQDLMIAASFLPAGADKPISISATFHASPETCERKHLGQWTYADPSSS